MTMFSDLRKRIETIMNEKADEERSPLGYLLHGASRLYQAGVVARGQLYDDRRVKISTLPCPVISIGNVTVGGTGKTPMTLFLARNLLARKLRPVILSRGYGGSASGQGGVVSDGRDILMDASQAGDEPFMMAEQLPGIPVCVGRDRFHMGMDAFSRFSPDIFILDDGFQHRKLSRNLDILLLDAEHPFGNGFLLPRGTLREPLSGLSRADVFVLTRSKDRDLSIEGFREKLRALNFQTKTVETPVYACSHTPVIRGMVKAGCHDRKVWDRKDSGSSVVFAFSGIAKNSDFQKGLTRCGFQVKEAMEFPDHHPYSLEDMKTIAARAQVSGASFLATTEKDLARIGNGATFPLDLMVMGVDLDFGIKESEFIDFVIKRLYP